MRNSSAFTSFEYNEERFLKGVRRDEMDVVGAMAALKVAEEIQRKKDSERAAKEAMKVVTITKGEVKAVKGDVSKRMKEYKEREKKVDRAAVTVSSDIDLSGEDPIPVVAKEKAPVVTKTTTSAVGKENESNLSEISTEQSTPVRQSNHKPKIELESWSKH